MYGAVQTPQQPGGFMRLFALLALLPLPALADPLAGKSYIIEMSSSQMASGYGEYLIPPLARALAGSPMRPQNGPGADLVVNIVTDSDVGRWVEGAGGRVWLYTISVTVGISPGETVLPYDGTPVFGARAVLQTPNPDREDELRCLITLAAKTALAEYRPKGRVKVDGAACGRG